MKNFFSNPPYKIWPVLLAATFILESLLSVGDSGSAPPPLRSQPAIGFGETTVSLGGTPYTLASHPRFMLDGPNGPVTRALTTKNISSNRWWSALTGCVSATSATCADLYRNPFMGNQVYRRRDSTLTSITVASHIATAQLSTTHAFLPGATPTVSGASHSGLNGTFTISSPLPSGWSFSFPVPDLPNGTYTESALQVSLPNYQRADADYAFYHTANAALYSYITTDAPTRAAAIWWLDHVEQIMSSFACDETRHYCAGRVYDVDDGRSYQEKAILAYTLMYSYLTNTEKSAFAMKMLNDNDTNHHGLNSVGQACTANHMLDGGAGQITANGTTTLVGTGTVFTSTLHTGDTIWSLSSRGGDVSINIAAMKVMYVQDDTHVILALNPGSFTSSFKYARAWQSGDCGLLWFIKHHQVDWYARPADYPPSGGRTQSATNNLQNHAWWCDFSLGLGLADDDPRAVALLQNAYNDWTRNALPSFKSWWTGFTGSGPGYGPGRMAGYTAQIVRVLTNSVPGLPSLTDGVYLKRVLPYVLFYHMAGSFQVQAQINIAPGYGDSYGQADQGVIAPTFWNYIKVLYPSSAETGWANWWDESAIYPYFGPSSNSGDYIPDNYINVDPSWPTSLPTIPTQYLFRQTDYSECITHADWLNCDPNAQVAQVISRQGFTLASDTVAMMNAMGVGLLDSHDGTGLPGALGIYKNQGLLSGDRALFGGNGSGNSIISVGGDSNTNLPFYSKITRWAGADPHGDPQSRYAYALADTTGYFKNNVARANRSFVHFKKTGTQDYILTYDDVELSSASTIRSYFHYVQNGQPGEGTTALAGNTVTEQCLAASNCSLASKFAAPIGKSVFAYTDNPDGRYPDGAGYTYRVSVCPSSSATSCDDTLNSMELLSVHSPTTNSARTNVNSSVLKIDSTWTGVLINDAGPKVVVFARGGRLNTELTFSPSFAGTAQVLIAGLAPGAYTVFTGSGTPTLATVVAGDGTLYFEAAAGVYTITRS
jgi:hypothetical protein